MRITINGYIAKLIDWGMKAAAKRKPAELIQMILNQNFSAFLIKSVIKAISKKGFNQIRL